MERIERSRFLELVQAMKEGKAKEKRCQDADLHLKDNFRRIHKRSPKNYIKIYRG